MNIRLRSTALRRSGQRSTDPEALLSVADSEGKLSPDEVKRMNPVFAPSRVGQVNQREAGPRLRGWIPILFVHLHQATVVDLLAHISKRECGDVGEYAADRGDKHHDEHRQHDGRPLPARNHGYEEQPVQHPGRDGAMCDAHQALAAQMKTVDL